MKTLLARIRGEIWAMEPSAFGNLEMIAARHDAGVVLTNEEIAAVTREDLCAHLAAAAGAGADWREQGYWVDGSVAVIPMTGVIAKYSSLVNGSSQPKGTSVERMRTGFRNAQADPKVKSRLFLSDSPGGSVRDIAEFADEVRAGDASGKPVHAHAWGMMASAADWIGAQARHVTATRGAAVGSIGVYSGLVDSTKAAEKEGITVHLIHFPKGSNKGAGLPGVPVTQENLDAAQAEIDAIGSQFVGDLAAGRRVPREKAMSWADGRIRIGQDAVDAGLVDAISTYEQAVGDMNAMYGDARGPMRPAAVVSVGAGKAAASGEGATMKTSALLMGAGAALCLSPGDAGGGGSDGGGTTNGGSGGGGGGSATGLAPDVLARIDQARKDGQAEGAAAAAKRLADLRGVVAGFEHVNGVKEALAKAETDASVSVEAFKTQVMDAMRKGVPPRGDVDVGVGASGFDKKIANFELVCIQKAQPEIVKAIEEGGPKADAVARRLNFFGGDGLTPPQQAAKAFAAANQSGLRAVRLQTIMGEFVQQAGFGASQDPQELMAQVQSLQFRRAASGPQAAGNTTSDFPGLLSNVARKVLLASFDLQETTWQYWCGRGTNVDYKNADLMSLSEGPNLLLRLEGAPAKRASLNERKSQVAVKPYSREFAWTYQMVRNDDLNAFAQTPILFAAAGKRLPQQLQSAMLEANPSMLYDNTSLFAGYDYAATPIAYHGNYAEDGIDDCGPLDYDVLYKAYTHMTLQTGYGEDKAKIVIKPTFLVVHPANFLKAKQIVAAEFIPSTGDKREPNVLRGVLQVISDPYLTDPLAWYLAGDRLNPSIVVHFLDGVEEPTIFQKPMTTPMEMAFEVNLFGVGVAAVNHENIYKNSGIAH